jgi:hypothetical protein
MKTLALGLLTGALIGGITGAVVSPVKDKEIYTASFTIDIPPMGVSYANSDQGAIESWVHCEKCKQGVIRKEDNKCSYCGK